MNIHNSFLGSVSKKEITGSRSKWVNYLLYAHSGNNLSIQGIIPMGFRIIISSEIKAPFPLPSILPGTLGLFFGSVKKKTYKKE